MHERMKGVGILRKFPFFLSSRPKEVKGTGLRSDSLVLLICNYSSYRCIPLLKGLDKVDEGEFKKFP